MKKLRPQSETYWKGLYRALDIVQREIKQMRKLEGALVKAIQGPWSRNPDRAASPDKPEGPDEKA